MHELAIARSIVELAEAQAEHHGSSEIEELELEIGFLAGVECHTLKFAIESAVRHSKLEKTRIVYHYVTGEGVCSDCENVFVMNTMLTPCPFCGSYLVKIVKGKELRIKSIVVK